ncbi:unnamed protein product [[Candida] boidinii]|nr:unnamed protein product [[Candida] boidinii]
MKFSFNSIIDASLLKYEVVIISLELIKNLKTKKLTKLNRMIIYQSNLTDVLFIDVIKSPPLYIMVINDEITVPVNDKNLIKFVHGVMVFVLDGIEFLEFFKNLI